MLSECSKMRGYKRLVLTVLVGSTCSGMKQGISMKTDLDCIPCFLRQSLEAARMATHDKKTQVKVMKNVMEYLRSISFDKTPPEISMRVHQIIREISKCIDPYRNVKSQSNKNAMSLYPELKRIIESSDDRLLTAVKLAIAGNVIDYGVPNRFDINDTIKNVLKKDFAINDYESFKKDLDSATNVLYIADNAGEIVFDKLLIKELNGKNIFFAVKSGPIINDATVEDAGFAGIDKIAKVLTNGSPSPGVLLNHCSKEFLSCYKKADVVIAKGQGNYESLSNEKNIYFLLMTKCELVAEDLNVRIGNMILKGGR